jgi:hypothetical protein
MERCFLIKDNSESEATFTTTESHIKRYWDLSQLDNNEIVLGEFLSEAKCGDVWKTESEEIIYLDFVGDSF